MGNCRVEIFSEPWSAPCSITLLLPYVLCLLLGLSLPGLLTAPGTCLLEALYLPQTVFL